MGWRVGTGEVARGKMGGDSSWKEEEVREEVGACVLGIKDNRGIICIVWEGTSV